MHGEPVPSDVLASIAPSSYARRGCGRSPPLAVCGTRAALPPWRRADSGAALPLPLAVWLAAQRRPPCGPLTRARRCSPSRACTSLKQCGGGPSGRARRMASLDDSVRCVSRAGHGGERKHPRRGSFCATGTEARQAAVGAPARACTEQLSRAGAGQQVQAPTSRLVSLLANLRYMSARLLLDKHACRKYFHSQFLWYKANSYRTVIAKLLSF